MKNMRAIVINQYGNASKLQEETVSIPIIQSENEMLVRIHAAGVSPFDAHVREGWYKDSNDFKLPAILGCELSGEVIAIGKTVSRFKIGDAIFAYLDYRRLGAYAEYAIVKENEAALKPDIISHYEAAAASMNALTAWQALFDVGQLSQGQRVLIHAASGGVGHLAVQLAKIQGAYVIGTASQRNHDWLYRLGADELIDYTTTKFEETVKEVDLVIDGIGGDTLLKSFLVTKKNGIVATLIDFDKIKKAENYSIQGKTVIALPNPRQLEKIAKLLATSRLKAHVNKVLPLHLAREAHQLVESKKIAGKIILEVYSNEQ